MGYWPWHEAVSRGLASADSSKGVVLGRPNARLPPPKISGCPFSVPGLWSRRDLAALA